MKSERRVGSIVGFVHGSAHLATYLVRLITRVRMMAAGLTLLGGVDLSADALRDLVIELNQGAREAISRESTAAPIAARNLALLHLAMARSLTPNPVAGDSQVGAVMRTGGAGIEILRTLYPSTYWDARTYLPGDPDVESECFRSGRDVARRLLVERSDDGASRTITYRPRSDPGKWRRTAPKFRPPELPQWPGVRPFVILDVAPIRVPPPPALESAEYATAWEEVRLLGSLDSSVRSIEETETARFWSYFSYTSTPPGSWNAIAGLLAVSRELSGEATADLFCVLNLALADAGIVAHDAKFHYNFWRPVHAIARANEDGNTRTAPVPDWRPLLEEPPHPEYVSGHSTFSGAGAQILTLFFGTEDLPFSLASESLVDRPRHYENPWAAAREAGRSRIYGGIHFEFSNQAGLEAGRLVADTVFERTCHEIGGLGPERAESN